MSDIQTHRPWRFYCAATGQFHPGSMLLPTEQAVADNTPPGYVATQIEADPACQRMDLATGQLVDHTPAPSAPQWDAPSARAERDRLLADCDWVVMRSVEQGAPVPAPWAAYRTALRDLTAQPGFPAAITWPKPPNP